MIWNWLRSLAPLLQPVGFLWLIVTVGLIFCLYRKHWGSAGLTCFLSLSIYLIGATSLPVDLLCSLESPYATNRITNLPKADAIVMLGGVLRTSKNDTFGFNLGSAADRVLTAAELWRERRAPILVLGGGEASLSPAQSFGEGKLLERWLGVEQVPAGAIISLKPSLTTVEAAQQVRDLVNQHKWQRVLLVTSAAHMRRAEALFVQMKIPVVPVPCDFEGLTARENETSNWLPRYDGFVLLSRYLHEFVGWYVYRAQGLVGAEPPGPAKG